MADVQGEGMSKSAKRRAAKKARDSAAVEAEAPAPEPPAPEPKAKAKGKAKAKAEPAAPPAPEPKAEPKAKAKGKAKAKAEPEPPAPAPKAKAKGKAEAKAAAKAEPAPKAAAEPPAAPKAAAKPAAKGKAKAKAAAKVEEVQEKPKESTELPVNYVIDDGSGPAWEVSSGVTKKQQKRKERVEEKAATGVGGRAVPGATPAPTNTVPGMGPQAKAGARGGVSQSVAADVERILAMKNPNAAAVEEKKEEGPSSTATINVPEPRIGIVIGPKGAKIKMLQEKTGARIDTTGNLFTITGPPQGVTQAETAIKELIEKGYCAMQYDDFAENFVNVHPSHFPDLIGKQGAIVRKIKEELGVEINFPETQKNAPASKKYKVSLAGSTQAVEKAKNVINNIVMYSHDELTHPGLVHEELEIESWAWRYIIGTAGSEMKHIQNNYKVKVNIPREHSSNEKVLVVGELDAVQRAKAYIEKLVWNAEHKTSGRDKVDDGDTWGDEEPEEDWMKQYMYKR